MSVVMACAVKEMKFWVALFVQAKMNKAVLPGFLRLRSYVTEKIVNRLKI